MSTKTTLRLRVIPNAKRDEVIGVHGESIKVKVRAPAVEGRANEGLREFLAECLVVSARDIEIVSGSKSRDKIVEITGLGSEEARERLLSGK